MHKIIKYTFFMQNPVAGMMSPAQGKETGNAVRARILLPIVKKLELFQLTKKEIVFKVERKELFLK